METMIHETRADVASILTRTIKIMNIRLPHQVDINVPLDVNQQLEKNHIVMQ